MEVSKSVTVDVMAYLHAGLNNYVIKKG